MLLTALLLDVIEVEILDDGGSVDLIQLIVDEEGSDDTTDDGDQEPFGVSSRT